MSELKQLGFGIYLDIDQLQKQSQKAQQSFKDISDAAGKQGKSMTDSFNKASSGIGAGLGSLVARFASVTAAVALLTKTLKSLVQTNMDFERKASELAAVLGTTKDGVKELSDAARELGRYTEFTASEVEELQIALARLGFTNQQIIDMQEPILKFAQAVGADLGAAAAFAGSSLRAFGMNATQTTRLLDVMAASTSKSALDFGKLEASMSTIAPVAHAFGLSMEDTVTFLGALANAGFDASTAATAMRNILLNLADANGSLAKGLGHTANTFPEIIASLKECTARGIDLNSTLEMTDKRSVAAFNALISGADDANTLREALGNCDGTLNQMSETMTDNLQGAVKGLQSAWAELLLTFQNSTGPMTDVVKWLTKMVNALADFNKEVQTGGKTKADKQFDQSILEEFKKRREAWGDEEMLKNYEQWVKDADAAYERAIDTYNASSTRKNKKALEEAGNYAIALSDMRSEIYALVKKGSEDDKAVSDLTTTTTNNTVKTLTDAEKKAIAKAAEELAVVQKDMWIKANDAAVAAMREGTAKELAELENKRLQELDAIDKEQKAIETLAKKAGQTVSQATYDSLEQRRTDTNKAAAIERERIETEQAEYIANLYRQLGDIFSSEERRKVDEIKRTYEAQRKELDKALAGGTINEAQHTELKATIDRAEQKQIQDSWVQTFGNYNQKLEALKTEWAERIKDVPAEFADEANKAMDAAISDFIINNSETKSAITRLFDDMTEKAVSDLRQIAAEGQELYDFLASGTWDSSIGEKLNITQEQFNTLRRSPEELAKIRKAIKEITDQADSSDTIFKKFSAGLKEIFAAGDNSTKLQKGLSKVSSAVSQVTAVTQVLSNAFKDIAEGSGSDAMQSVSDGIGVAMDAMGSAMSGAQAGAAFGPWGAAAGAAIGLVTSLYKNLSKLHDENIQRRIEGLQQQIDSLNLSYEKLGKLAEDAFGQNKVNYINQQNEALRKQNLLIQQQIREEESKKSSDDEKIKEWNNKLKENRELIEENKKAAIDAIFGDDIQSAITAFSDAQTDAWSAGEKGAANAKEQVRKMLQQMVSEAVKAYVQAQGSMDRIRSAMQDAMADEIITDEERRRIEEMAENLSNEIQNKYGWASELFSNPEEREGLKGTGIAASQDSVDNLDARMTTMQEHTYTLVQGQQELIRVSSAILDKVSGIEDHTAGSERELAEVRRNIVSVKNTMDDISLKGVKIRN